MSICLFKKAVGGFDAANGVTNYKNYLFKFEAPKLRKPRNIKLIWHAFVTVKVEGKFIEISILAVPLNCILGTRSVNPSEFPSILFCAVVSPPVANILPVWTIGHE